MWFIWLVLSSSLSSQVFPQCLEVAAPFCNADCTKVQYCAGAASTPVTLGSCAAGRFCSSSDLTCSSTFCTASAPVTCSVGGGQQMPDPYQCDKSYLCVEIGSAPVMQCQCPSGSFYNTETQCTTGPCSRTAPNCSVVGAGYAYPDDSGFFYVCDAERVARVGKCPEDNMIFSEPDQRCVALELRALTPKPQAGLGTCQPYSTTITTTTTTTETPTTPQLPTCQTSGEVLLGLNCTSYYICNSSLSPILVNCKTNYHYDAQRKGCVIGPC